MSEMSFEEELVSLVPDLRAFGKSLTRDNARADDLVQDSMVKALSNQDKFQPGTSMRAWMFTILRNTFYSMKRKQKWEVEDVDGAYQDSLSQKPAQDGVMDLADFRRAFDTLPSDQREALMLVGAAGMTYEEAAEICDCAVGTVKSRVNRARGRLTDLLHLNDDEHGRTEGTTLAAMIEAST
ncbi:sigma-70 family RNA polymerase sigma factor [Pontivivens insulae]|uniref:ECF RNA polymerase sigma factor EcfG n=1 Tax=Pontivivens insulae TaxID=1639689 RepID=A0A2R8A8B1_9RHOB|nr:sigma-70 family RNA polymerase sigma factor [Pontivivens insulae]RED18579.1 RNA polymerase sigma-70 factor (ECF subfamily) [Pontivivens insulae]SPF28477.1 ECF RNA polymerase sigma factor EcfG [Pontivivens insulae]